MTLLLSFLFSIIISVTLIEYTTKKTSLDNKKIFILYIIVFGLTSTIITFLSWIPLILSVAIFNISVGGFIYVTLSAITEEFSKYIVSRTSVRIINKNNKKNDIIIYILTAIGFSFIENMIYIYNCINEYGLLSASLIVFVRIICSTPMHVALGIITYNLSDSLTYRKTNIKNILLNTVMGVVIVISTGLIHGLYNYTSSEMSGLNNAGIINILLIVFFIGIIMSVKEYAEKQMENDINDYIDIDDNKKNFKFSSKKELCENTSEYEILNQNQYFQDDYLSSTENDDYDLDVAAIDITELYYNEK